MNLSEQFDGTPAGVARDDLAAAFDGTAAAEMPEPIPAGEYVARCVAAALEESRTGTPCFALRLEIASGEHAGRRLVSRWYLSPKALPYSRRDLAALGLSTFAQLERGDTPAGPVRARVALRRDDTGGTFNEVRAVLPCSPGEAVAAQNTRRTTAWQTPPQDNEAKTAPVAPVPVAAEPKPEPPAAPAVADELPAGLVDAGLL